MKRDTLVVWFIENELELYKNMIDTTHYVTPDTPNIYHAEGSVWTHTMMVMSWIEANKTLQPKDKIALLTTAMLHDIGKTKTKEVKEANDEKPIRNSFNGHEGVSAFLAVGILKKLKKDFPEIYTDSLIELIIRLVSTHGVAVEGQGDYFYNLRMLFREADKMGAVRNVDEGLFSQYQNRKFTKLNKVQDDKEIVFMVGLPNSGKSTLVAKEYSDYYILSRDTLLEQYAESLEGYDGTYNTSYNIIHNNAEERTKFNEYFDKMVRTVSKNENKVLIDMTMLNLSSRRKMMNNFPKHTRKAVVVMTDMETIKEREIIRSEQGKAIPDFVYVNMMRSFVYPVVEEGFTEIKLVIN